jgi:predicted transcriptional regulator
LKSIFEFASKHIEPSLKRSLILKLLSRNMSRAEIARCLGVSSSLVTRYVKGERGIHDFTVIREIDQKLEKLSDEVATRKLCGEGVYVEIAKLTLYVLSKKYACGVHYLASRDVDPSKCNICPSLFREVVPTIA